MQLFRILILSAIGLLILAGLSSCDLIKDDENPNQMPEVWFINVPVDSSEFNYAPEVHWQGYDPDGFVNGYEYHDDASVEAVQAYQAGDAALQAYIDGLDASVWVPTDEASQVIYLLTEEGDTTEHVFMIRCIDNLGTYSQVKVRTFYRSNQRPNPPQLRWALHDLRCREAGDPDDGYDTLYVVCDTLFWDDYVTATWPGVEFLWQGSDPDSRLTNIIPLEYSFALVNAEGDSMELPVYDDSSHVIGYRAGWSDWTAGTQTILYGHPTGDYNFFLKCRDDGLTESEIVRAEFYAIKPQRDKFLLVVDSNAELTPIDRVRMGREPDLIMNFYNGENGVVEDAFQIAEQLRTNPDVIASSPNQEMIPSLGNYDEQVVFLQNRNDDPLPYSFIHQFETIWIIDDDNAAISPTVAPLRKQVLMDFMNVGGNVMLTGRRILNGQFAMNIGSPPDQFFANYFDLASVNPKVADAFDDFQGCAAGNSGYLPIQLNPDIMDSLMWGANTFDCLPGVEWFGRTTARTGYDFSVTLMNYISCTINDEFFITDVDLDVKSSTPALAILSIPEDSSWNRILDVTRVYNVTKDVYGDFMYVNPNSSGTLTPDPEIYVSTPAYAGAWVNDDVLEVDFHYIPISVDHDQPVGERFARMDGVTDITIHPDGSIEIHITAKSRFKTSLYTFPLSFMDNTPVEEGVPWAPEIGPVGPVTFLIAVEMLWFKQSVDFTFEQG